MTHRVVSAVVGLVVVVLIVAACAFAWAVSAKVPVTAGSPAAAPAIPHGVTGDKADCVKCHEIAKLPASHADFTVGDCRSCHGQAGMVGIPHPVDRADRGLRHVPLRLGGHAAGDAPQLPHVELRGLPRHACRRPRCRTRRPAWRSAA